MVSGLFLGFVSLIYSLTSKFRQEKHRIPARPPLWGDIENNRGCQTLQYTPYRFNMQSLAQPPARSSAKPSEITRPSVLGRKLLFLLSVVVLALCLEARLHAGEHELIVLWCRRFGRFAIEGNIEVLQELRTQIIHLHP